MFAVIVLQKFTLISFASAFTAKLSTSRSEKFRPRV